MGIFSGLTSPSSWKKRSEPSFRSATETAPWARESPLSKGFLLLLKSTTLSPSFQPRIFRASALSRGLNSVRSTPDGTTVDLFFRHQSRSRSRTPVQSIAEARSADNCESNNEIQLRRNPL